MIYNLHQYSYSLPKYSQIIHYSEEKTMETRIIKKVFNKNEIYRDVKTQKVCEQSQEVNVGKIKQNTSI